MLEMLKLLLRLAFKIIQKKGETEINCKQLISWFSHFMTRTFVKSSYF